MKLLNFRRKEQIFYKTSLIKMTTLFISSYKCDQLKKTATYHAIQRELIERILFAPSINFDIYFLINYLSRSNMRTIL